MVVNVTVIGPVFVGVSLELLSAARVRTDVEYPHFEMQQGVHQGAVIQGRLVQSTSAKTVELKRASIKCDGFCNSN